MRYLINVFMIYMLCACASIKAPDSFVYKEISTPTFKIATWQKISNHIQPIKIYIEGDGYAFNSAGRPTQNPTPKGKMLQEIAFGDNSPNVVYMARPCQFVKSKICSQRHWTTARFAPEIMNSMGFAIKEIAGSQEVVLIGFSGGAQVAGLIAVNKPDIKVTKLITIAGNLAHRTWTDYHKLPPLNESMDLNDYREQYLKIPQVHYVGGQDDNILPIITQNFVGNKDLIIIIPNATHNKNWESIYSLIRKDGLSGY